MQQIIEIKEQNAEVGISKLIKCRIDGYARGDYGYEKNVAKPNERIEGLFQKNHPVGIKCKILGLGHHLFGNYGYEQDDDAANDLIDKRAQLGFPFALRCKYIRLRGDRVGREAQYAFLREYLFIPPL